MKKEHTTLFPRSTSVFVIPSLLLRRKKGPFYYFVYTRHTSLLFCFLDFFFHRLYRLSKSVFSRRFFGPFFGGLFLHASYLSLSLSLSLLLLVLLCVYLLLAPEREKKTPRSSGVDDTTVRRSLSSFLALGSSKASLEILLKVFCVSHFYSFWESFDWKEKDPNV